MAAPVDPAMFKPALIVLTAAGVVIPLFHRLRISPIIGFILIGMAVGPFGLGALSARLPMLSLITITDPEAMSRIGELGVVTLMFMIGLEVSMARLMLMRRLVFGLGGLQVVLCTVVLAGLGRLSGMPTGAAIAIGLALSMSSTAVVVQILSGERRLGSSEGRAALAVLLLQDLAAVPALFAIGVLGHAATNAEEDLQAILIEIATAGLSILSLIVAGRLALRPLFRSVARTDSPELFMAACLVVVLGTGMVTALAGLSMAMGALVAGLLLAETEYRRQIEVTIEPFKGLLVGVFLIAIGAGLDLGRIAAAPFSLLGAAVGLVAIKLAITAALTRCFLRSTLASVQAALLLAPGGEFGFVILTAALAAGLIGADDQQVGLILAAVTMATIPLLSQLGERLGRRASAAGIDPALLAPQPRDDPPRVILAGFGRVGETVAALLDVHGIPYVAIDNDADRVAVLRNQGKPVYWGDMTQVALLRHLNLPSARALVVTMHDHAACDALVTMARAERADLLIVARARDAEHAAGLYALGATDAVPETIEASLQLSESVLVDLGVPMGPVIASIHEQRATFQAQIRAMAPDAVIRPRGRRRLRDARAGGAGV